MATEVASAFVSLMPSFKGGQAAIGRELGGIGDKAGKQAGGRFGRVFATAAQKPFRALGAAAIALFAGQQIVGFFKEANAEARESQKVGAITANAIKVTGGAAKVTSAQVDALAASISNKTAVDDEAVQAGSNLLLTFKNIKNEGTGLNAVFDRSTAAAVDLSAAGFGSIEGASKMLGKALNDPLNGMTALGRAGVTFTDAQKKQVKGMVEAGNVLGAQKLILAEVESQVGGAAAASATAGERLTTIWNNTKEAIGTRLLPILDRLYAWFADQIPKIMAFAGDVGDVLGPAFSKAGEFVSAFVRGLKGGEANGAGPLVDIVNAGKSLRDTFERLRPGLEKVGAFFRDVFLPAVRDAAPVVLGFVTAGLGKLPGAIDAVVAGGAALIAFYREHSTELKIAAIVITAIMLPALVRLGVASLVSAGRQAVAWTIATAGSIAAKASYIATSLIMVGRWVLMGTVALFQAARIAAAWLIAMGPIGWIIAAVIALTVLIIANWDTIKAALSAAWNWIKRTAIAVWNAIKAFFANRWNAMKSDAIGIWNAIKGALSTAWNAIKGAATTAWNAIKGAISKAWNAIKSTVAKAATGVVDYIRKLPGRFLKALGNLGSLLIGAGKDLIRGLINGIKNMAGNAVEAAKGIVGDAVSGAKALLGISSPSKVFESFGEYLGEGLVLGMNSQTTAVSKAAKRMAAAADVGDMLSAPNLPELRLPQQRIGWDGAAVLENLEPAPTYVTVELDGQPFAALIRTQQSEANRTIRRRAGAGAGGIR